MVIKLINIWYLIIPIFVVRLKHYDKLENNTALPSKISIMAVNILHWDLKIALHVIFSLHLTLEHFIEPIF